MADYIRREDVVTWLRDKADEPKNQERFCTFEVACVELADEIELGPYLHPGVPKSVDVLENKWISVNDALPPFDQKVLAYVKNKDPNGRFNPDGIYVAELKDKIPVSDPKGEKNIWGVPWYDSEWTVWAWSHFSEPCVTHWMPLPEIP